MKPLGYCVSEKAKPGLLGIGGVSDDVVPMGVTLKSVLTLPKLAPAFTPTYQPVQL
jgi:hypothetical protein